MSLSNIYPSSLHPTLLSPAATCDGEFTGKVQSEVIKGFLGGSADKEFTCNAGDLGLIPEAQEAWEWVLRHSPAGNQKPASQTAVNLKLRCRHGVDSYPNLWES